MAFFETEVNEYISHIEEYKNIVKSLNLKFKYDYNEITHM